jgi:DnaK suppressor protein
MTSAPTEPWAGPAAAAGGRARLEAERERLAAVIGDLRDELAAIAESTAAGPDDEHDAEGSTVAYERARVQALLAHAERSAAHIEAAAANMEGGTTCRHCGQPIAEERLIALPATATCVSCAAAGVAPPRDARMGR